MARVSQQRLGKADSSPPKYTAKIKMGMESCDFSCAYFGFNDGTRASLQLKRHQGVEITFSQSFSGSLYGICAYIGFFGTAIEHPGSHSYSDLAHSIPGALQDSSGTRYTAMVLVPNECVSRPHCAFNPQIGQEANKEPFGTCYRSKFVL